MAARCQEIPWYQFGLETCRQQLVPCIAVSSIARLQFKHCQRLLLLTYFIMDRGTTSLALYY